ncbi:unnamed protein product [Clonostachys rhizophaga]|uniref:Uncharacterized protein n=1 Tax=Clonostachys rhizophaga TaxID=160324 RepID=A0A9N9VY36_9HYPO|nr:unnamed protein product [Clonostachys rhizophaga]
MTSPQKGSSVQMTQMMETCSSILPATQLKIASAFWAGASADSYQPTNLQPHAEYYVQQCRAAYHALRSCLPVTKHDDILLVVQKIKEGLQRHEIIDNCDSLAGNITANSKIEKSEMLGKTLDLVASLLLMVDVGKPPVDRIWTGRSYRCWDQGDVYSFTASIFPVQTSARNERIQLSDDFNARNLSVIAGLKVELTNNLLDHLEVVDFRGHTTVMIFHHASFLKNQEHPLFPAGFVEETIQTLALLFPQNSWYNESIKWYEKHLKPGLADADSNVLDCGQLLMRDINEYRYWHDKLLRLKELFDSAKPRTMRQWWNDRREGTQWYGLWVAVGFTVFFGLVQSIEGAIQVYKAYNPETGTDL